MKLKSILLSASALIFASSSFGQGTVGYVTTGTDKYVLVEEATGNWCPYCVDGYQDLEQSVRILPKTLIASWHGPQTATGTEPMMIPGWPAGNPYTAQSGWIAGFPMGTVDRAIVGSGTVGKSRPWSDDVPIRAAVPAKFKVSMLCKYDTTTAVRKITVKITAKCLTTSTGIYRMSMLVTEDSLSAATYPQSSNQSSATTACNGLPSWWTGLGSPIPAAKYAHNAVVRAMIDTANTLWGDLAMTNPTVGDSVTKTYEYVIPVAQKKNQMHVIGILAKYGSTTSDRAIENSIEASVKNMPLTFPAIVPPAGLNEVANTVLDVQVYPNPARNFITVKGVLANPADVTVNIFNAVGQVVSSNEYKANGSIFGEVIMLNNFSNGMYFLNMSTVDGTVTKQFTVNK